MLHSLSTSVCLFVSLLIPSLSQPHSPLSSCLSLSSLSLSHSPGLELFFLLLSLSSKLFSTWYLVCTLHVFPFFPFLYQWTASTDSPPSSFISLLLIFSFYTLMVSTLQYLHLLKLLFVIAQPQKHLHFNNSRTHLTCFINYISRETSCGVVIKWQHLLVK